MEKYKTEIVKIHRENPYLKVYVNISEDMNKLKDFEESLPSVDHANKTMNMAGTRESLTVYPMKTYLIEDVQNDVEKNLNNYFSRK